jgi:hypothetical protein
MIKKLFLLTLIVVAVAAFAAAQTLPQYQLNYYSNRNNSAGADQFVRIINSGVTGTPLSPNHGTLCADIYVFDATQEMIECCHCPITANGLAELSILHDLTASPLTGFPAPNSGVVKIVTDAYPNCNETAPAPVLGMLAWGTHVQQPISGAFVTTEDEFLGSLLAADELAFLGQACSFVQYLGSGKGVCKCGSGG